MKKHFAALTIALLVFLCGHAQSTAKEWYDQGISLKKSEKYKEAITAFNKAIGLQANYADAMYQLGWCYNEEDMYEEALAALNKEAIAGSTDKARNNYETGYAYKGLKKYDQALSSFNKAIELDNEYALAYKERGNTYYKKKEYEKALADYDKYIALSKEISDAVFYYNKGWAENELEKFNEAIRSMKKCVELDDQYANAYSEMGFAYYKLNLNDESIANYRIAIALDNETDYHPVIGLGDVYYENLKNYDSAIFYYQKGIQLTQTNQTTYYRLGWCYNDKDRFAEAVEPLKQAVLLNASYDAARTELGYAYYKLNKYDEALAQFRPIMEHNAKDELSRYYAGFCYYLKEDQGNLKKMIDELKALNSTKYVETLMKYVK